MTVPDDVTITIAASTELVVASPASADALAHPCHVQGSIFSQTFLNSEYTIIRPWSFEQSRQGFSNSEGKDTMAEIPRKW